MPGTFVQSATSASDLGGGATAALQFSTQNTGAGNLLVAIVECYAAATTLSSVTDSQNNTWVVLPNIGGSTYNFYLAYALNTAGGTKPTVTFHYSGTTGSVYAVIAEYSGVNTFRAAAAGAAGTGTTIVSNNVSAVTGDLLIGLAMVYTAANSSFTLGSGYSNLEVSGAIYTNTWCALENKTAGSTGNVDATFTGPPSTTNFWAGIAAFYHQASSASGGIIPTVFTTETFGARIMSPRTSIIGTGQKTGIYR
jgi:hypothetical protein